MAYKRTVAIDLLYLLNFSLNDPKIDLIRVLSVDLPNIFSLAEYHKLTACVAFALENIGLDDETLKPWKQAKSMAIRKNILLNNERKQIYDYMEDNSIIHVSLKGIVLQDFYPKFGMREMGDNDILYDPTYQEQMHDFMLSRGYHTEFYKKIHHDEYQKPPLYKGLSQFMVGKPL